MQIKKRCDKCNFNLPIEEFKNKNSVWCIECEYLYSNIYRHLVESKICWICEEQLKITKFIKSYTYSSKDGYDPICKKCVQKMTSEKRKIKLKEIYTEIRNAKKSG